MTRGVSIVIPNWNGLELLERFLSSVIAAAVKYSKDFEAPTEIIVVDDGSGDDSVKWLLNQGFVDDGDGASGRTEPGANENGRLDDPSAPILRLVRNEVNRGFGPACNHGFESAGYPLVFLLNNDVDVDINSIAPLVENFTDASVFSAHCRVFDLETGLECGSGKVGGFSRGFIRVHRSYVNIPETAGEKEKEGRYSMFATGGSAMFDRAAFLKIGGFDNLLAPLYWEDVDISYRAWKRGFSVLYEPRSVVHHRVSSTIRKFNKRAIRRIQQRNRLIYHWVNLHDPALLASHLIWVAVLALTAPLRLQPDFLLSVGAALKKLGQIRKRRVEEKIAARRSDREVFAIFTSLEGRPDIFAYDNYSELTAGPLERSR